MRKETVLFIVLASIMTLVLFSCSKKRATSPELPGDIATVTGTPVYTISETITWTDTKGQQFALYLPAAPVGAQVPVVMYLHGYTENPISSPPWIVTAINQIEPCAVFLPYRPSSEGASAWGGTYDISLRQSMVDTLAELDGIIISRNFDTSRQYLYGDSMGAEGVLKLLVEYPDRFAGAVSVAGYTVISGAGPMAVEMAQTPLWLIWGGDDTSLSAEDINIYNLIVASGGTHVKYTEYPGQGHVESILSAASEPGLCAWLLNQRRP
jgi:predicted peptidase